MTLADAKKHLNIDSTFTDDDAYITSLINVSEEMVLRHLDYSSYAEMLTRLNVQTVPTPIIHACKLLIGNLYMNRESVSTAVQTKIPDSYDYLLATYKNRVNYQG